MSGAPLTDAPLPGAAPAANGAAPPLSMDGFEIALDEPSTADPLARPKFFPTKLETSTSSATKASAHGSAVATELGALVRVVAMGAPCPAGVPHLWQKRAPGLSAAPQAEQKPPGGSAFGLFEAGVFLSGGIMWVIKYRNEGRRVHFHFPDVVRRAVGEQIVARKRTDRGQKTNYGRA